MSRIQRMVEHYDRLPVGEAFVHPADLIHLARTRNLRPDARIFDIGCGQGQAAIALAEAFPQAEVMGIDISSGQVEHAQAAASRAQVRNVSFQLSNWQNFRLPPNGMDLIVSTQVIQFVEDEHAFAHYIATSLAPGGQVFLRTVLLPEEDPGRSFANRVLSQFIHFTVRFYSEDNLTELFREVGLGCFRIDKEEFALDELPPLRAGILKRELQNERLTIDDVQRWFWVGTVCATRR